LASKTIDLAANDYVTDELPTLSVEEETQVEDLSTPAVNYLGRLTTRLTALLKYYHAVSFSDFVRLGDKYPDSPDKMNIFVTTWRMAREHHATAAYQDLIFLCWLDLKPRNVRRYLSRGHYHNALVVIIYAWMHDHKIKEITKKDLLEKFCGGQYWDPPYSDLIKVCVLAGEKEGLFSISGETITLLPTTSTELAAHAKRSRDLSPEDLLPLPNRNDPCFCNSGRKYKKCCIRYLERSDIWYD
jgi:hypothetical protein